MMFSLSNIIVPFWLLLSLLEPKMADLLAPLLSYRDPAGAVKPVTNLAEWEEKRGQILKAIEEVTGPLPDRSHLPSLDVVVTDTAQTTSYHRYSINFRVRENERLTAYLYIPFRKSISGKLPAMVVLHGTGDGGKRLVDGESPLRNRSVAAELASRGYIVIAPDYPSMGESQHYNFDADSYDSGTMKGIFNHMRCVDLLVNRDDVDAEKIGVIGHSLGGHNAMFLGAFDTRPKVIVSSSGWTPWNFYDIGEEGSRKYGGKLGPWAQDRYMPRIRDRYNLDAAKLPFDFPEIIALLAPRTFFSNSPTNDANFDVKGVVKGIAEAKKVYNFLNAERNIQVRYPKAGHDFPLEVRLEAYRMLDASFGHIASAGDVK